MALTRRARRRLFILVTVLLVVVGLGVGTWFVQQSIKDARAIEARSAGLAAAAAGDWEAAMRELGLAVARDQDDLEALLVFAEARSRVPEPNNRHLITAMSYYTRATTLASRPGIDQETLGRALSGRARMELATRAIVRLEETALAILEIDPADVEALDYLLEIKKVRGEYLPESTDLLVRGERTDLAWLQAMRDAESGVALRWALERLALQPTSIDRREQVLGVIRDGGSEDLQLLRDGEIRESTTDLVKAWVAEAGPNDPMPWLILSNERLRRNELDGARAAADVAETIGMRDPMLLLRAVSIRESLRTSEDQARAQNLLEQAEQAVQSDPWAAMNLAIRHWNAGRSEDAFRVLDAATAESDTKALSEDQRADVLANAALLALLDDRDDLDARVAVFRELLESTTLDPGVRDQLQQVSEILRLGRLDRLGEVDFAVMQTAISTMQGNPLVQTAYGDILARTGYQTLANEAWKRAGELVGQRSLPIGRRGVRGLLDDQSVAEAFRQAVRFAGGTQTLASVISLIEAWLALDAAGLTAREVEPQFTEYDSPLELAQKVFEESEASDEDSDLILPLVAEAAIRGGKPDLARAMIDRAVARKASAPVLLRLAAISQSYDLGRDDELLERLRAQAESETEKDRIAVLEAARLRRAGDPEAAMTLIEVRFADRADAAGRRLLGLERLDHAMAIDGPIDEAIALLLSVATEEKVLRRVQAAAIERGDLEASLAVVDRARELFGTDSVPTILAEAEHVLGFEADDTDSVRQAVIRVDPVVSGGTGGAPLELALIRLLMASDSTQLERSIEVLRESVRSRPARFDTVVLLIELLQRAGRFDEAQEQVQKLYRRRAAAPPEIQRLMPALLAGQGDDELVAASVCEIAEQTGRPLDRLECARARYRSGEFAEADRILDGLLADDKRPFEVDIEVAARFVRRGDPDAGISFIRTSSVFPSDLRRNVALASLLLELQRWQELATLLAELGPDGDTSAEVCLIRAILLLNGPDRNPSAAMLALDQAADLAPDDPGVLRRNVTIRLADTEVRASARDAIDLLGRLRPDEAELMRLAYDASPTGERFMPTAEHVVRAQTLVSMQPTSRPAWVLALEILGAAYQQALVDADTTLTARRGEAWIAIAEGAIGRFPGDSVFPAQLSRIHLALGNIDDALAAAREGVRRAGDGVRLANAIPVALVESRTGDYAAVLRTLEPYRQEIENGPDERPQAWQLLFTALLRSGRVDDAWTLFQARSSASEPNGLLPWLVAAEGALPQAARAAVDLAIMTVPPGPARLPVVGALGSVYRRTGNAEVRSRMETLLDEIAASSTEPAVAMQVELTRVGLDEQVDPIGTIDRYAALVDRLPAGTIDRLKRFETLTSAERQQVAPIANAAIMAMNNFAAVTAVAVLDGRVEPDQAAAVLTKASMVADDLGEIVGDAPEVLDTRALVALARGDGSKAVELANTAIRAAPQRADFRFTLAKGLALVGESVKAEVQAREAIRMHRRVPEPDEESIADIQGFLDRLPR